MNNIKEKLSEILDRQANSPFLFIGSGFSRRYLELETWEELLKRFSSPLQDNFNYYLSKSDNDLSLCAELIAKDYFDFWWKSPEKVSERNEHEKTANNSSSPLKISISQYLHQRSELNIINQTFNEEIEAFKKMNAQGFITTNWDLLLEKLLPNYKVYIGQSSIVTGVPQNVGEIFKIHGCCSSPNSLVMTKADYKEFQQKSAYLSAKLITIFVEHPIIFIGYSSSDSNIISLLQSVVIGLDSTGIQKLQRNLIFIRRCNGKRIEGIEQFVIATNTVQIPVTQINTDDFASIYEVIAEAKQRLPAHFLRFCREQIYDIVSSENPSNKLTLVDIDKVENYKDLEFVVGVGVKEKISTNLGYKSLNAEHLFKSLLFDEPLLEAERILTELLPDLHKRNPKSFLPIFKFIKDVSVFNEFDAINRYKFLKDWIILIPERYQTDSYKARFERDWENKSTTEIITDNTVQMAACFLVFQTRNKIEIEVLKQFLVKNIESLFCKSSTSMRKAACFYDFLLHCPWGNI